MHTWQMKCTVGMLYADVANKIREMICPQHFHNILVTNLRWQVVTGCYYWSKKIILVFDSNLNQ